MREYYCYVYYDKNWQAYYVGKGSKRRADYRNDLITVPDNNHIQRFYFASEWEAFECEVELIALWRRSIDGGTLVNQTFGGAGCRGAIRSSEVIAKASKARKALPNLKEIIEKCNQATRTPITLINISTKAVHTFISVQEAARQLGLNPPHISAMRYGKRKSHKGWRVSNE